jgi:hypothetical protein
MKKVASAFLVSLLLISDSLAGIRGPGKYSGVVIFDRWDTCFIYSGVYLMYVSESTKSPLRKYQNHSMRINALEVYQPMNPGDGRIGKYRILGQARTKRAYIQVEGLKLAVTANFRDDGLPNFKLQIQNGSKKKIELHSSELALTMLRKKAGEEAPFDPSDGASYAMITRNSFRDSRWQGTSNSLNDGATWSIGEKNALPDQFYLEPGQSRVIAITFRLPVGEYDFLCGYGGGVHEDKSIASNKVAFDVNEQGRATMVSVAGR